jgi:hypothetical protein
MSTALKTIIALTLCAGTIAMAQTRPQAQMQAAPAQVAQPAAQSVTQQLAPNAGQPADLNAVLMQVQQSTSSASADIGKLHVERWKTDADQKQQLQHIGESLQKSIANAVPVLVTNVQSSKGSVSATFKLYHNLNVIYENLNYLADVAGGLGKKEEFDPLAADCAALESARQSLSTYIAESAGRLEAANRQLSITPAAAQTQVPGKKGRLLRTNKSETSKNETVISKPIKAKILWNFSPQGGVYLRVRNCCIP